MKKILLTGANGYIGKRLLPHLIDAGYHVVCGVRDVSRFNTSEYKSSSITIIRLDLLDQSTLENIPEDIDAAYYLVHSMSSSKNYEEMERLSASNFKARMNEVKPEQVIYLSGIANASSLSKHLNSRRLVEEILHSGGYNTTTLRAGIIIGSGSASFEIIRDIVEKLPIMVTPKWLNTRCQPIAIRDVLQFLTKSLFNKKTYNSNFDIGGDDVLSYKEMLIGFAQVRGLKRSIFTLPVMTPKLSSYWLYFVTSTSYKLAGALVQSMKTEVVCRDNKLKDLLGLETLSYTKAIKKAFVKIDSFEVLSSWKDSYISSELSDYLSNRTNVPEFGCFTDKRSFVITNKSQVINKVWSIGGENGWYKADLLWKIRGYLDKAVGGVGLRRGRTNPNHIGVGDALDFWRVILADKNNGRLILFAEMKLPGEAWLEFKVSNDRIEQIATFRPKGLMGRLYWLSVLPFHSIVFKGMIKEIAQG